MNSITLKVADLNDIGNISKIESECFSEPWSENAIREFISHNENTILCAYSDNELCGYVSETKVLDEIQIANVAVSQKFRRCGIASLLIETLINKCYSQNIALMTLEVRKSNTPAIKLYEKYNFRPEGIRKNYYRNPTEDAIIMNRNFNKGI